ncbi:hypothetical protein [Spirosoma utsteinense]|uniref:Uncharacterized protein n=1 Tax=Spirosoma utsteinense TaxID=2585773 RepID=A0ABR6VZX9_9BACT|nr:hypothetical protein [Spirosoma utsteinense]MBC3789906.1 hypothetical protein [Spirosoma utsteinense]
MKTRLPYSNRNQLVLSANGTMLHNGIKFSLAGDTLLRQCREK